MGFFAGPALAGFLLAFANVPTAFAFDALTFVWSALFVVTIRYPAKESPNVAASASASIPEDVKADSRTRLMLAKRSSVGSTLCSLLLADVGTLQSSYGTSTNFRVSPSRRDKTDEEIMTNEPGSTNEHPLSNARVVDLATWEEARKQLLVREKAHTRNGDAIAAARRRLPMVEFDGTVLVSGPDGQVPFLNLFQGRDELIVYKHMWYDGAPHQGQCEGCTMTAWHVNDASYLNARGVSLAFVTSGPWDEVAPYVKFMGYNQDWYSARGLEEPVGGEMGVVACFLRDGDRVFLTYTTTGRGNEPTMAVLSLLDMTPYGRGEAWEDNPEGSPVAGEVKEGPATVDHPNGWFWRSDANGVPLWGPTSRPVPQWTRPGATPVETLGRQNDPH